MGAGLFFAPTFLAKARAAAAANGVAQLTGVVPISAMEDSCTLAFSSGKIPHVMRNNLVTHINLRLPGNIGRLANAIPACDKRIVQLLDYLKSAKPEDDEYYHHKMALAFGTAANCAYYEVFKPVHSNFSDAETKQEAMLYQDTALLRAISNEGHSSNVSVRQFEEILKVMLPRTITRVHTLIPDYEDGIGWVNRMSEWRMQTPNVFEQYAEAYAAPKMDKLKKYVTAVNFYDKNDAAILACRKLQNAEMVKLDELEKAVSAKANSLYAKAIAKGYENIHATAAYLEGKVGTDKLVAQLQLS